MSSHDFQMPTLDETDEIRNIKPLPPSQESSQEPMQPHTHHPSPPIRQSSTNTDNLHESSDNSNAHYLSEPSLSEDTNTNTSYPTPTSPLHQAIVTHSPSNTSLSSIGSPSINNSTFTQGRKKIQYQFTYADRKLAPMNAMTSPIKDDGEDTVENEKEDNQQVVEKKVQISSECIIPSHNRTESNVTCTPESQRYLTAQESSEEDDNDDDDLSDGSSGISYDDEKDNDEKEDDDAILGDEISHISEDPVNISATNISFDVSDSEEVEHTDTIIEQNQEKVYSPENRRVTATISTSPMETAKNQEELITPKRKTSSNDLNILSTEQEQDLRQKLVKSISLPVSLQEDESKRKRPNSADKRHRRTRSGDDKAATLVGKSAWAGMELHQLPLPHEREDDDDDTFDSSKNPLERNENVTTSKLSSTSNIDARKTRRRSRRNSPVSEQALKSPNLQQNPMQEHVASPKDGIPISTRFSPKVSAGIVRSGDVKRDEEYIMQSIERQDSFASANTAESDFSWISRGTVGLNTSINDSFVKSSPLDKGNIGGSMLTPPTANKERIRKEIGHSDGLQNMPHHSEEQIRKEKAFDEHMKEISNLPRSPTRPPKLQAEGKYPTFVCPRCKTEQRQFVTVASATKKTEEQSKFFAFYFFIYTILALFICGSEEGWPPLDCLYFSVTTLTGTGFGDYVPQSPSAKIICSIFIYIGISCFGLILGDMHVNALDEAARKQAKENMSANCPNCARLDSSLRSEYHGDNSTLTSDYIAERKYNFSRASYDPANETTSLLQLERKTDPLYFGSTGLNTINESPSPGHEDKFGTEYPIIPPQPQFSSPGATVPVATMTRQKHTRHSSLDSPGMNNIFDPGYMAASRKKVDKARFQHPDNVLPIDDGVSDIDDQESRDNFSTWSGASNEIETNELYAPVSRIKAAKYVFLTLKQACINSIVVILFGSIGFYYIEKMSIVDAFYFTLGTYALCCTRIILSFYFRSWFSYLFLFGNSHVHYSWIRRRCTTNTSW